MFVLVSNWEQDVKSSCNSVIMNIYSLFPCRNRWVCLVMTLHSHPETYTQFMVSTCLHRHYSFFNDHLESVSCGFQVRTILLLIFIPLRENAWLALFKNTFKILPRPNKTQGCSETTNMQLGQSDSKWCYYAGKNIAAVLSNSVRIRLCCIAVAAPVFLKKKN